MAGLKPTLHQIGLFHTITSLSYSHCAFTSKVLRFPKMMRPFGYRVVEYGNGTSESLADEHVQILTEDELQTGCGAWLEAVKRTPQTEMLHGDQLHFVRAALAERLMQSATGYEHPLVFHGDTAVRGSPHHTRFERKLIEELAKRVQPGDIICHPFGRAHEPIVPRTPDGKPDFSRNFHVESGLGYGDSPFGAFRVFESLAWMHYHQGMERRGGDDYECVIPNYFDLDDWPVWTGPKDDYLLYFGRITPIKGLDIVAAIARAGQRVVAVGQGIPDPAWIAAGVEFRPPVVGRARAELLGRARAVLVPSRYTEPFAGTAVESQLVGTPAITSDFGAMTETVEQGVTGYRCRVLGEWLEAARRVGELSPRVISERARSLYSLEACGRRYDAFFTQLRGLLALEGEQLHDWGDPDSHYWF